ncbi:E3 ubiquitin-protein ligase RGLG2 isoform X2 [Zea mays]|uniref:E3 ubiquitin-protein ligase RGLG1 n=1 Tax=Zea mays TaxID=4577 RepID=A0A1D6LS14_MAIZE|nr:E3 ubiquitin-protein ligase RGLG2 isoform X2 [Zea mays]XP_020394973.1 E3 ubiquitin-protein ligase RGLG2 isoform X2 [Zea mays]XP_020394974.1 E3 ubiquitin-protein ligase RGLG2 isoform X2 [Zea mays]XP_035816004.1 E3 ubiquitin-protein ligase RGLG2 isoform X2 [Zea mays]AQK82241.1 E3 ubiquitin-protein ligase RGLG1 [Zea mays]AQK82244.1 E3 ubiquitin-protein ligase RGLG1 [Zea mays]AQK82246.1 E3 ubiquitin-protein ligase RGLG1 [Zea mays]AQK82248.1 E3 ubiquitin-protein ligase RGLG1 [Zea mays]AQK8224|eukprot:XP_020394972.1 E3 ubiquitin-protein ligase RGLG2 isoform X2 [Zea mays]
MGQKDSKPSHGYGYSSYDYGSASSGYTSRNTGNSSSSYSVRYAPSSENSVQPETHARLQRKYSKIGDDYRSLSQVTEALAQAGLESSNLIVGIDFTKSNEWTGKISFNRRCLHDIGNTPNPYEQAISIIGRTLSAFDEDNLIPCFGFGDASTHDQEVFSFYPENRPCNGFEEALDRYREIVPTLRLAGPTSFAPMIETAIGIVDSTGGQYHVLLIIADGQVTRSVDTQSGQLSPQERDTIDAIVRASQFPLSIVLVGVGDGPWDMMHQFDDNIPARSFDNFQFVNFTEIMSKSIAADRKEAEFALSALMEIPTQYKATIDLQLLGRRQRITPRIALPPPTRTAYSRSSSFSQQSGVYSRSSSFDQQTSGASQQRSESLKQQKKPAAPKRPDTYASERALEDRILCPICMYKSKDLAFGCGHQTCYECGRNLERCPLCQQNITTRIRLY